VQSTVKQTVKKCLEAFPEVDEAVVSHTEGTAVVSLNAPADLAALEKSCDGTRV